MTDSEWQRFSAQLAEWRENPVTQALRKAMDKVVANRKAELERLFWAGRVDLEPQRLAALMVDQWIDDFFNSSADDVRKVTEDG